MPVQSVQNPGERERHSAAAADRIEELSNLQTGLVCDCRGRRKARSVRRRMIACCWYQLAQSEQRRSTIKPWIARDVRRFGFRPFGPGSLAATARALY
jgi:hypothetical protein